MKQNITIKILTVSIVVARYLFKARNFTPYSRSTLETREEYWSRNEKVTFVSKELSLAEHKSILIFEYEILSTETQVSGLVPTAAAIGMYASWNPAVGYNY